MPAMYAHDRFGADVSKRVREDLKNIIQKYYPQYQIGLQGPDLFFFYRPWGHNPVNRYGVHLHGVSALPFFEHACKVIRYKGRDSMEYAYLLGFICHFILDSECHPYVQQMIEKTGVQHLEIEEEFEKKLIRMDGGDAVSYPLAKLVPTDRETAEAIVPFFAKGITAEIVEQSLKDLRTVKRLFTRPGAFGQFVINTLMKLSGKYKEMKGLMLQRRDNPACIASSEGLMQHYDAAIQEAVRMMVNFDAALYGACALDARFDRTFE